MAPRLPILLCLIALSRTFADTTTAVVLDSFSPALVANKYEPSAETTPVESTLLTSTTTDIPRVPVEEVTAAAQGGGYDYATIGESSEDSSGMSTEDQGTVTAQGSSGGPTTTNDGTVTAEGGGGGSTTTSEEPPSSTTTSEEPPSTTITPEDPSTSTTMYGSPTSRPGDVEVSINEVIEVIDATEIQDGGIVTEDGGVVTADGGISIIEVSETSSPDEESTSVATIDILPIPIAAVTEEGPISTVSTFAIMPVDPPSIIPVIAAVTLPSVPAVSSAPPETSLKPPPTLTTRGNLTRTATAVPVLFTGGARQEMRGTGVCSVFALLGVLAFGIVLL